MDFVSLTIVNWHEPTSFIFLQAPALILALWMAWKIARGYTASVYLFIDSILESDAVVNFEHENITYTIEPSHHEMMKDAGFVLTGRTWKQKS
jgi:hypothetical protein